MFKISVSLRFLLIAFICGAVLMSLEIVGSRILAPHFGNTIYVWGSLIGIFIGSLALGYYLGGKLADAYPKKFPLALLIAITGIYLIALPLFAPQICLWLELRLLEISMRGAVLLASMLLFAFPSILLGSVTPYLVRLVAHDIEHIGRVAGLLYAVSTFGSLFGTLFTAFWLIPELGIILIVRLLGISLFISVLVLSLKAKQVVSLRGAKRRSNPVLYLLFISIAIAAPLFFLNPNLALNLKPDEKLIQVQDSIYHRIAVIDNDYGVRLMRFDKGLQSAIYLNQPGFPTALTYTEYFWLPFLWKPEAKKVAFMGGGAGVLPRMFAQYLPEVKVDVVEIDPLVIKAAQDYFYFKPNQDQLAVFNMDARQFLKSKQAADAYDIIILDAYGLAAQIPFHLTTLEYFQELKNRLSPDGSILINVFSAGKGERGKIFQHIYKTIAQVFNQVYVFPLKLKTNKSQNYIIIANNYKQRLTTAELQQRARKVQAILQVPVRNLALYASHNLSVFDLQALKEPRTKVLTDDWAPIDTWRH